MPTEAETIYAEIARLYHELQQLPDATIPRRDSSPAYLALEAQIRALSAAYVTTVTTTRQGSARRRARS